LLNDVGDPISRVIRSAISAIFAAYSPEKACTTSIRCSGVIRGQGPWSNAARAAVTAASMSAGLPSGTRATTSSECGLTTSRTSEVAGAAQPPSMKKVSRSKSVMGAPRIRVRG
jgi:hypothetical protein